MLFTLVVMMSIFGLQGQVTDTIKEIGFTYEPDELTVNAGDTVIFIGTEFHPLLEVSEATWTNNGTTPVEGGFNFPSGSGKVSFLEAGVHYYVCTAHVASQGMKGKLTVVTPTALPDISGNGFLSVYPIPLTGSTLYLNFKNKVQKNITITIFDLAGNMRVSLEGSTANGQFIIDCSSLPSGIFLMKLHSDDGDNYTKFVKQ